jgi:AcrR family transcriptional regulator
MILVKISAQEKERVRAGIMQSAERLFRKHGFAAATTRQIAAAAGVATGTVFNYFPTKDDLGLALLRERLAAADRDYTGQRRGDEPLAEDLFAYLWSCLKQLRAQRSFAGEVLQRASLPGQSPDGNGSSSPLPLLIPVSNILARHGITPCPVDTHLFAALWAGIASFWSRDKSKDQEDSMVVLDRSMRLFTDHILKEGLGYENR